MHLRKIKVWDMRYYWLRKHETHKHVKVHWKRGVDEEDPNLADYHTKHHSTIHHRGVRPLYVRDQILHNISTLQNASSVVRTLYVRNQLLHNISILQNASSVVRPLYLRNQLHQNITTIQHASSLLRGCIIPSQDPI